MRKPEGFVVKGKEHLVCKLKHSLHGLKQSPRCWNHTLDTHLKNTSSDPCIYMSSDKMIIIDAYVDDIILAVRIQKGSIK